MIEALNELIDDNGQVNYNLFLKYLKSNKESFISLSKHPYLIAKSLYDGFMEESYSQTSTVQFRMRDVIRKNTQSRQAYNGEKTTVAANMGSTSSFSRAIFALQKKEGIDGLANEIHFGRTAASNDIVISDGSISKKHGTIIIYYDQYFIIDNNSTNGISINGTEIEPETKVELPIDSDLTLGRVRFRFVDAEKLYNLVTKPG